MNNPLPIQTHPWITPDHLRRLAVVYLRQSTEEQVQKNTGSTEYQRNLAAIAREYGWPDSKIELIDEDLGKSGSSTERRAGWQRLQDMIDRNQVGAVFVATISRLSRQVLDFELFRIRAAFHNTLIYSDNRFINPADSNDAILSQITAMVAQYENHKRAEVMMQSRMIKARRGEVVSRLPVGWVKGPDGKYDYDPETKDTIRTIIDTFWQKRTLRGTVKALAQAGILIPSRKRGGRLHRAKPTATRVTFILKHPAFTGTYVFAKTRSQPGGPVLAGGQTKRKKLPEEEWIKIYNHHPAYMTLEEQQEIKSILTNNQFKRRYRVGRGRAVTQGLLRCALCDATLMVSYTKSGHSFMCRRSRDYAEKPCIRFNSNDLDESIVREVFKALKTPPEEIFEAALEASHVKERTRQDWIRSERERLAHEEMVAQERADLCRGRLPEVHFAALQKLEKIFQEKRQFEEKIALEPAPTNEKELEELCCIANDIPSLWHHEAVTHKERKEIIRCLVDHVVVAPSKEKLDATIFWKSGANTLLSVWRPQNRHHLIKELHAQKLTVSEIKERLAAGQTSTGQIVNMTLAGIQQSLKKMHLEPAKHSAEYLAVKAKAVELDREGQSLKAIARYFNKQGFASPSGKSWTHYMVEHLIRANGEKQESLANIHGRAIAEALAHGLTYQEMAVEFNDKNIRRRGGRVWTAQGVASRWKDLKRGDLDREQIQSKRSA